MSKPRTPRKEKKRIKNKSPLFWKTIIATKQLGFELRKLKFNPI